MKSDNKWIYIVGVAVLAVLVIIGVMWGGGDSDEATPDADAAEAGAEAGTESDGGEAVAEGDGGAGGSESADDAAAASDIEDPGETPTNPEACRAHCRSLAESGALASGATAESCIASLCSGGEGAEEDAEGEGEEAASNQPEPPPEVEPDIPDLPEDCQASCRMMQQRGELAAGTTLEACYAAMCGADEAAEE